MEKLQAKVNVNATVIGKGRHNIDICGYCSFSYPHCRKIRFPKTEKIKDNDKRDTSTTPIVITNPITKGQR